MPYEKIGRLSIFYNNIPPGETVTCYLSPIKAMATAAITLNEPTIIINGGPLTFPVVLESGSYLEFNHIEDCKMYNANGEVVRETRPDEGIPALMSGVNEVRFTCTAPLGYNPRTEVRIASLDQPLR